MSRAIAVCDGDEAVRTALESLAQRAGLCCRGFSSPEELAAALPLFLPDAALLRSDFGTERLRAFSRQLRSDCPDCVRILLAENGAGALAALSMRFDGLLELPVSGDALRECLERAFLARPWAFRTLSAGRGGAELRVRDVLYIEGENHYCRVFGRDGGATRLRARLGQLACRLEPCGFARCHRSYLVNLHCVCSCENGRLLLSDGRFVPVSESFRGQLLRLWQEQLLREYMRGRGAYREERE